MYVETNEYLPVEYMYLFVTIISTVIYEMMCGQHSAIQSLIF